MCGALDGKHMVIKCPKKSGSMYRNYKGFYTIVLLGLVHANFKFLWAHIVNGSASDAAVFSSSSLRQSTEENLVGFLDPELLLNDIPYFIGDNAFPLHPWLMVLCSHHYMELKERVHLQTVPCSPCCLRHSFTQLSVDNNGTVARDCEGRCLKSECLEQFIA